MILRICFSIKRKIIIKPVLVNNFWSNSDIKYQSKGDKKHYQLKNILIKLNNT